jgi:hypothetical protein
LSRETRKRSRSRDTIARTIPFPGRQLRPIMTRSEIMQRLQTIKNKGIQALKLLESEPSRSIHRLKFGAWPNGSKKSCEYNRMLPERAQKTMSVFELSVYSPTIEETWKKSGIGRLKIHGTLDKRWQEPLEAVVYNAGKYLTWIGGTDSLHLFKIGTTDGKWRCANAQTGRREHQTCGCQ